MKLYEINEEIEKLLDMQWEENLSDEDIKDTLDSLLMDKHDKCVNVALAIKNYKKDIEKFKEEEERLNARRRSMTKKMDWLKNYLTSFLNGEKIDDDPRVQVYYGSSEELIVDNPSALPSAFLIPQDVKIDKARIKKAIKDGQNIEGVHIEKKEHIVVR